MSGRKPPDAMSPAKMTSEPPYLENDLQAPRNHLRASSILSPKKNIRLLHPPKTFSLKNLNISKIHKHFLLKSPFQLRLKVLLDELVTRRRADIFCKSHWLLDYKTNFDI